MSKTLAILVNIVLLICGLYRKHSNYVLSVNPFGGKCSTQFRVTKASKCDFAILRAAKTSLTQRNGSEIKCEQEIN